jgi:hypothetical protein
MMATLTGNNGKITLAGTQVLNVKTYSCDIKADTIETSSMGTDARTYLKGLSSWSGSADVLIDTANLTGGANAIATLIATGGVVGDSAIACVFYLDSVGSPSGKNFAGNAIVTGFNVKSSMDGMVEGTISFQGSGAITYTA